MLNNRSIPRSTVIPELAYPDVTAAADWLCKAFGFTIRLRIGHHRIQLNVGDGAIVVIERHDPPDAPPGWTARGHSTMVRVEDANAHYERAKAQGAQILRPPADFPYGERQYNVEDVGGHFWTFTQSIADAAPEDWGGESVEL